MVEGFLKVFDFFICNFETYNLVVVFSLSLTVNRMENNLGDNIDHRDPRRFSILPLLLIKLFLVFIYHYDLAKTIN